MTFGNVLLCLCLVFIVVIIVNRIKEMKMRRKKRQRMKEIQTINIKKSDPVHEDKQEYYESKFRDVADLYEKGDEQKGNELLQDIYKETMHDME